MHGIYPFSPSVRHFSSNPLNPNDNTRRGELLPNAANLLAINMARVTSPIGVYRKPHRGDQLRRGSIIDILG